MKAWSSQFFWYIKIETTLIIANSKNSIKVKRITNYHKSLFFDITKIDDFWWKMLVSVELTKWIMWFIYFLYLLWIRHNCAKFHHCGICVTNVRRFNTDSFFIHEQPWKGLFWIRLKMLYEEPSFVSNGFQSNSSFEKKLKQKTILEKWESLFT